MCFHRKGLTVDKTAFYKHTSEQSVAVSCNYAGEHSTLLLTLVSELQNV